MKLSVVIISCNEEANIGRTLQSVQPLVNDGQGEIIVVDSGSTDHTVGIAQSYGARVFVEEWKGYAAQKNSAIEKATGDWILSLDADEELDAKLQNTIALVLRKWGEIDTYATSKGYTAHDVHTNFQVWHELDDANSLDTDLYFDGFSLRRKNHFLGRWIKHGGFWPDPKVRLFRRTKGRFEDRIVHESLVVAGEISQIHSGALFLHHSYPTLSGYIEHMNRYSSLGAEMAAAKGQKGSFSNIVLRPLFTFIYNYFFRLGFLDGREGLLLHLYHSVYVSWKYAKLWELTHKKSGTQ